jgi:Uma2 family endonuclease
MSDPSEKKRRATYQDVLDAPEHKVAEIINGELHLFPRPHGPHTSVATKLSRRLGPFDDDGDDGPGGWIILVEPELHLGEDVLVPDLAGWRRERMAVVPEGHFSLPPDWICEVLSKSTERIDRMEKLPIYAQAGVDHAWLISPRQRTLEVYRSSARRIFETIGLYRENDQACIVPFDAVELDLSRLWVDLPLPTRASEEAASYEW